VIQAWFVGETIAAGREGCIAARPQRRGLAEGRSLFANVFDASKQQRPKNVWHLRYQSAEAFRFSLPLVPVRSQVLRKRPHQPASVISAGCRPPRIGPSVRKRMLVPATD
jgi:hypothetical protein